MVAHAENMKTLCGTPLYVAPELVMESLYQQHKINSTGYSQAIDYWSAGVLLYQMLSCQLPFNAADYVELFKLIKDGVYHFEYAHACAFARFVRLVRLVRWCVWCVCVVVVVLVYGAVTNPGSRSSSFHCFSFTDPHIHKPSPLSVSVSHALCLSLDLLNITLSDEEWCEISDEAKDLVRKLLAIDPALRLTATQALQHPWLVRIA
jgi:serine/threonine protein kinase